MQKKMEDMQATLESTLHEGVAGAGHGCGNAVRQGRAEGGAH